MGKVRSNFILKLDDETIVGLKTETCVSFATGIGFYLRKGDRVRVFGKIYQDLNKFWGDDYIWVAAEHIYNETLGCFF